LALSGGLGGSGRSRGDVLYDESVSNEPDPRQSQPPADDEAVPRLPRGRGIKLSFAEIMRILMILAMLIGVLALRRPCAQSTGRFIESFEPPVDAGPVQTPGQLPAGRYIRVSGEMTEEELREKLELLAPSDAGAESAPGASPGAAQVQPSEDTPHDREPRNAPDRKSSMPAPGSPEPR
jgi:hypothetical protein